MERGMPFLMGRDWKVIAPLPFPWELILPHEAQAQKNHYQSLAQLRARGGLSPCEMIAIMEDRPWKPMSDDMALNQLTAILQKYNDQADVLDQMLTTETRQ